MRRLCGLLVVTLALGVALQQGGRAYAQAITVPVPGVNVVNVAEIIENSVPDVTTVIVFTVPEGQLLVITDLVISNSNETGACCQRVFRGGSAATSVIAVPARSAFSHTFNTGIIFVGGETVRVRNGASSGPTDFYLRGFLVSLGP